VIWYVSFCSVPFFSHKQRSGSYPVDSLWHISHHTFLCSLIAQFTFFSAFIHDQPNSRTVYIAPIHRFFMILVSFWLTGVRRIFFDEFSSEGASVQFWRYYCLSWQDSRGLFHFAPITTTFIFVITASFSNSYHLSTDKRLAVFNQCFVGATLCSWRRRVCDEPPEW
jgi:hypothetical protein